MLERRKRRWDYLPIEKIQEWARTITSESIWGDNFNRETMVTTDALSGKNLSIQLDDDTTWSFRFMDERHLHWVTPTAEGDDLYNASPIYGVDDVIFLHHYRAGLDLPRCTDLILDFYTGYCVLLDSFLGNPDAPREVMHDIKFGQIIGQEVRKDAVKPHFTNELTGKSVFWAHDETIRGIQYIFSSCRYYTYTMIDKEKGTCWQATNPCDYIKIRDNLYLMSVIEERQFGVQLTMLMNVKDMRDVQTCFGVGGSYERENRIETWMNCNRKGRFIEPFADLT